jgi:hypothetical protein
MAFLLAAFLWWTDFPFPYRATVFIVIGGGLIVWMLEAHRQKSNHKDR